MSIKPKKSRAKAGGAANQAQLRAKRILSEVQPLIRIYLGDNSSNFSATARRGIIVCPC
jgi:hypothetical protein